MERTEPARGTMIAGKYRIERTLGEGGMGVVVEATHAQLGNRVAIKLLRGPAGAEAMIRFQREARIAAQLTSEHIAKVSDMGQTKGGDLFLVMELLEGHDLATELAQRGTLPVSEAVDWVLQACEALSEAHLAGLVHRDVKPANLFLARRTRGRPPILKVLDFGLSKAHDGADGAELTQTSTQFGTPQYMSPEQVRSTKHVDARTDQHALALVLYEAIIGVPAYDGVSPAAVAVAIATAPPPHARERRGDIPPPLDQAIVRGLAKDPRDRYADLVGFAEAIAPFGSPLAKELLEAINAVPSSRELVRGASVTRASVSDIPPPIPAGAGPPPDPPSIPASDEPTTLDAGPPRGALPRPPDSADDVPTGRVDGKLPNLAAGDDDGIYDMLTRRFVSGNPQQEPGRVPIPAAGAPPPAPAAFRQPEPMPAPAAFRQPEPLPAPAAAPLPQSAVVTVARRSPVAKRRGRWPDIGTFLLVTALFVLAAGIGIVATLWWMGRGPFTP